MIRVAIADDQGLVRRGLRLMLEGADDLRVVGEAANGIEAVELVLRETPDVIVMDIRMPELDGIEATRRLAERRSPTRVLVVTTFDLDAYVFEALRAGAGGFLLKDSAPESLPDAVRTVARGDSLLAPSVTRQLVEHFVRRTSPDEGLATRLGELTDRELDVMRLIARGMTNAELASELYLSEATVKTHVTAILSKLGLRNRAQIVVAAYETGVVEVGGSPLAASDSTGSRARTSQRPPSGP